MSLWEREHRERMELEATIAAHLIVVAICALIITAALVFD